MAIVGKAVGAGGSKKVLDFVYSGDYKIREDGVVELLSSGIINFPKEQTIDVFMVGGGGKGGQSLSSRATAAGGGAGGQARTFYNVVVSPEQNIAVTIGAGSNDNSGTTYRFGGNTVFGSFVSKGGCSAFRPYGTSTSTQQYDLQKGAWGGSGGGGGTAVGGSDGHDGETGIGTDRQFGGSGQMDSTREFGEPGGKLYAGGGGGGNDITGEPFAGGEGGGGNGGAPLGEIKKDPEPGSTNTGGGGGGGATTSTTTGHHIGANGGSGIICFRPSVGVKTEVLNGTYRLNDTLTRPSFSGQVVDGHWLDTDLAKLWSIGVHGDYLGVMFNPDYRVPIYDLYDFNTNTYTTTVSTWRKCTLENCQVRKEFYDWWIANTTLVT